MTFWLQRDWQTETARQIQAALARVHDDLKPCGYGRREWTSAVLQALIPVARAACPTSAGNAVCGLARPLDAECRGEWLYDFACWIEGRTMPDEGFLGLPIVAESEWGVWRDIWDDFDKLTQARAGLRVLIFALYGSTPPNWAELLLKRARNFGQYDLGDAWLLACWSDSGFTFKSTLWD